MKKIIAASIVMIGFATVSNAQTGSTVNDAQASATIVAPIVLEKLIPMNFGTIAVGAGGGVVTLDFTNGVTQVGDLTLMNGANPATSGTFKVTGTEDYTFAITLPADGVVALAGAGDEMPVDAFESSIGLTSTLDAGTEKEFAVGAILTVNDGQLPGVYTATYSVTVDYN